MNDPKEQCQNNIKFSSLLHSVIKAFIWNLHFDICHFLIDKNISHPPQPHPLLLPGLFIRQFLLHLR